MDIPDYIITAIITGAISGGLACLFSYLTLNSRIVKLETINEEVIKPFWKGLSDVFEKAVLASMGTPEAKKKRARMLLEKYHARTLTYDEATELSSIAEKCFKKAQERDDHSKMMSLTLLIGTLDVLIEDLKKKVKLKETQLARAQ